ncbi:P-II family nitrogen regulator [Candidatus Nitrosarchaeum limnium]|jgi:nitrogen regulatory protein P-II 1|uniref:Nitrogen regulatory protein P-II n=1 Tax=Candidatus Nitrosarchaeum limnium BG20 TaxID=859192 RepID=S2EIG7_9ARCH|nr:P-II family nitrogen regulator [Candidatus Nitrosarchaeum limnium]EPA04532.1 nitrogen regulatory protein P-II [Candidatus Nitrosarchaeum limnium BG20]
MKRIEATIQVDKIGPVSDAIKEIVGGFTILEGNGRGSGTRQTMRAGRGTGTFVAEFNKVATVSTIVEDSKVEQVIKAISDSAFSGKAGDGIIVISTVDDVVNIASKKRGSEAL